MIKVLLSVTLLSFVYNVHASASNKELHQDLRLLKAIGGEARVDAKDRIVICSKNVRSPGGD